MISKGIFQKATMTHTKKVDLWFDISTYLPSAVR